MSNKTKLNEYVKSFFLAHTNTKIELISSSAMLSFLYFSKIRTKSTSPQVQLLFCTMPMRPAHFLLVCFSDYKNCETVVWEGKLNFIKIDVASVNYGKGYFTFKLCCVMFQQVYVLNDEKARSWSSRSKE